MNKNRIEKLEEKIKDLHLHPRKIKYSLTTKGATETFTLFWFVHVKPVIEYSKGMAKKYDANIEVSWLSAILHDIARLDDLEPHEEISAEKSYNILLEEGFNKEIAEAVKNTVLTHRCKEYKPKTLEQKILVTADTLSHFKPPFYLWRSYVNPKSFKEQLEDCLEKLGRDYNEKIFFKEERELVKKEYEVLKNWFEYYSKISQ